MINQDLKNEMGLRYSRKMAYNAYGLAKWGNYTYKSRLELLIFNKNTKDE